jgi:HlyD family secretion protein
MPWAFSRKEQKMLRQSCLLKRGIKTTAIGLGIIMILMAVSGCSKKGETTEVRPQGKPVKVVTPRQGSIRPSVDFTGTVIPITDVDIVSKMPGRVAAVSVKEGDTVTQGQLLIQIEDDDYVAGMRQTEANLEATRVQLSKAKTGYVLQGAQVEVGIDQSVQGTMQATYSSETARLAMENAQLDRDRMRRLFARGAVSKQQLEAYELKYDTARKNYETSQSAIRNAQESLNMARANRATIDLKRDDIAATEAQIQALQAALDLARLNVRNCRITAPINGTITFKNVDKGEIVTAMPTGQPLLRIVDNSIVNLEGDVGEEKIGKITRGAQAEIRVDAFPDKIFTGTLDTIIAAADLKTRGFRVKIAIPNRTGELKSGMFGRGSILQAPVTGLSIPRSCLIITEEGAGPEEAEKTKKPSGKLYFVFIKDRDKARKVPVAVGAMDEREAIITKGLTAGNEVVTLGQAILQDNDPIMIAR